MFEVYQENGRGDLMNPNCDPEGCEFKKHDPVKACFSEDEGICLNPTRVIVFNLIEVFK